ncbi:ribonuclease P protein component [Pedobacter sp. HMF7647]|uniref:Ribonuclease P protein component n=1 Tax=Hufsiella arboris TaxID=2695275 RepID=A0A7K1YCB6_9SPHI|nr:ribonuclease P protein component [Hufsiella arboris]MXV52227.1 ribonuclease P protein component [Hufsiella arboris]
MYTFKKEERLCSEKLIQGLFSSGSSFILYPFRITWMAASDESAQLVRVVISVPKRNFKRAVDRNVIKRRIREAYRLNKQELLYQQIEGKNRIVLSIHYVGKEIFPFSFVEKKLKSTLLKLSDEFHEKVVD